MRRWEETGIFLYMHSNKQIEKDNKSPDLKMILLLTHPYLWVTFVVSLTEGMGVGGALLNISLDVAVKYFF